MAEFDSGGLSAVSAFFGVDDKKKSVDEPHAASQHRGRHGVGSSIKQQQVKSSDDATIGRVLKVGKRKRHAADDDNDDDASNESQVEHEEEDGRTALAAEKPTKASTGTVPQVEIKKPKKKKKGKKERQAETAEEEAREDKSLEEAPDSNDAPKEDLEKSKQRKRRKIRSRQKNIYKDKRLTQHKPSHLILGRAEFQGRPLTAETRAKLNLAPSRSSRAQQHENEDDTANKEESKDHSSNSEGVKLAIDDLLDEGEAQGGNDDSANVVEEHQDQKRHKTKKKKRKKSKYKNLQ